MIKQWIPRERGRIDVVIPDKLARMGDPGAGIGDRIALINLPIPAQPKPICGSVAEAIGYDLSPSNPVLVCEMEVKTPFGPESGIRIVAEAHQA
jgi:hypothetical protein